MNLDRQQHQLVAYGTSGGGSLPQGQARDWVMLYISGALRLQGTVAESLRRGMDVSSADEQTSSGRAGLDVVMSSQAAITEIRRRSGLTWDQLANLFGVSRRSVHFWASGKPLNAVNEERLGRLLAMIRKVDRGNVRETRALILTALDDGTIPFDLMVRGQFKEASDLLGQGPQRILPVLPALSKDAQAARMPVPPQELVGAVHDTVHRDVGQTRVARAVKVKGDR